MIISQQFTCFQTVKGINIFVCICKCVNDCETKLSFTNEEEKHSINVSIPPFFIIYFNRPKICITFPLDQWRATHDTVGVDVITQGKTSYCVERVIQGGLGGGVHLIDTAR